MHDLFDYDAPLGFPGKIAEKLFLTEYLRKLLQQRNDVLRKTAETEEWREYLP